ncbi:MAG: hypothetical protein AAF251_10085 [Pseudomonadota bacterium]
MRVKLALASAVTLALSACSSGTIEDEDGEQTGEYTVNQITGETSATIETEDGTTTVRSGSSVPVDLPGGFTVYPGANVISNTVVKQGEGSGTLVTMSSNDSPGEVAAFYKDQAEKAGITIQMEMKTNGAQIIGGESGDGLTFSIMASPTEDGTTAQLTIGKEID